MKAITRAQLATIFIDLITPFEGGAIDETRLAALVKWQAARGICGFVVGGATGENATLTWQEKLAIAAIVRAQAGRYACIILCIGSSDTAATIREVEQAARADIDAVLLTTPYYSKPSQAGLVVHAATVAEHSRMSILLDDDPDRCGVQLSISALTELASCPAIIGVLDRRGDVRRCMAITHAIPGRYAVMSGQIDTFVCHRLTGGTGVVSGLAVLFPALCGWLIAALRQEDYATAQHLLAGIQAASNLLTLEPSPQRLKAALSLQRPGAILPETRLGADAIEPDWNKLMLGALAELPRDGAIIRPDPNAARSAESPFDDQVERAAAERSHIEQGWMRAGARHGRH